MFDSTRLIIKGCLLAVLMTELLRANADKTKGVDIYMKDIQVYKNNQTLEPFDVVVHDEKPVDDYSQESHLSGNKDQDDNLQDQNIHNDSFTGSSVDGDNYLYVVSIWGDNRYHKVKELKRFKLFRYCSGSLLSPTWVLTAAHCLGKDIQFVGVPNPEHDKDIHQHRLFKKILEQIPHPSYHLFKPQPFESLFDFKLSSCNNDIGLIHTEELIIKHYGILHGAEYKTLIGKPVYFVGYNNKSIDNKHIDFSYRAYHASRFDEFYKQMKQYQSQTLMKGEGIIFTDNPKKEKSVVNSFCEPSLTVAPKCNDIKHSCRGADSGGPLLYRDKIVGVLSSVYSLATENMPSACFYIPVSPYLEWITTNAERE